MSTGHFLPVGSFINRIVGFRRFLLPLALAAGVLLFSGCLNLQYDVKVKAVTADPTPAPSPVTYRFGEEPKDPAQRKTHLLATTYARRALATAGFVEAAGPVAAPALQIEVTAWVNGPVPRLATPQKKVFETRQPGYTDSSRVVLENVGVTSTSPSNLSVAGQNVQVGAVGPDAHPAPRAAGTELVYAKHLRLLAFPAKATPLASAPVKPVWVVEAMTEDAEPALHLFLAGLAATAAAHAGKSTGGVQTFHKTEVDRDVALVQHGK